MDIHRVPQPEFLGALVHFFSQQKHVDPLNGTLSSNNLNVTTHEKTKPLFFGMIVESLQKTFPNHLGDMFEAYFYATAVVLASAFNVMLMHVSTKCNGITGTVWLMLSFALSIFPNFTVYSFSYVSLCNTLFFLYIYVNCLSLSFSLALKPYLLSQMHLGMKMRVALCSMIYRKSLRLSKNALGETTVGQVVNLLSNDVGRLDIAIIFLHFLWVGPLETLAVTYLMYLEVN